MQKILELLRRLLNLTSSTSSDAPQKQSQSTPQPRISTKQVEPEDDVNERTPVEAGAANEAPWLAIARREDGTVEASGARSNPRIVAYYRDAGHPEVTDDEVAWCAAFVGACLKRAGYVNTGSLLARSYLKYGVKLAKPRLGAISVFKRGNSGTEGHVGFYVGEDHDSVFVLGGNQWNPKTSRSEIVNVSRVPKSKLLSYQWPPSMRKSQVAQGLMTSATGQVLQQSAQPVADLFTQAGAELKLLDGLAPKLAIVGVILTVAGLVYAFWARYRGMKEHGI